MDSINRLSIVRKTLESYAERTIRELTQEIYADPDAEWIEQNLPGDLIARATRKCAHIVVVNPNWDIMEAVAATDFSFHTVEAA